MKKLFVISLSVLLCLDISAQVRQLYDFVVPRDGSFREALAAANGRADTAQRFRIFILEGDYIIPTEGVTKGGDEKEYGDPRTYLKTPNVSIIGESRDHTTLTNTTPPPTWDNGFGAACPLEGIGKGDVLIIEKQSLHTYLQDFTMRSGMGDKTGRNIVLHDRSNFTIAKNICIWGYQDTYVSNNQRGRFYFDGGIIRGRTDYICGKGDVYFKGVTFQQCDKAGYLAVPSKPRKYGYVMQYCYIKSENPDVTYWLGRPWGKGTPTAIWINTKIDPTPVGGSPILQQAGEKEGWGWADMSGGWPARFAEYNTMFTTGETVSLDKRRTLWVDKEGVSHENNPRLTTFEMSQYTMANVLDGWDPTPDAAAAPVPTNVRIQKNRLTWDDNQKVLLYAVCCNGKVVDFTTECSYKVKGRKSDVWSVRAANQMGGLGIAVEALPPTEASVAWDTLFIDGPKGKLHSVLLKPRLAEGKRCAAVLLCHGFGGSLHGDLLERIGNDLLEHNIATLRFSFNGHGQSDGNFEDMTVTSEVEDAKTLVRWLREQPWCNGKIGIGGESQGGVVTGMTAGEMGDTLRAAALMCPAAVLRDDAIRGNTMGSRYDPLNLKEGVPMGKDRKLGKAFIEEAFGLDIYGVTSRYQGPMMILHGTGDRIAPYTYGERYHRQASDHSRLYLIPAAAHDFSAERHNVADLAANFLAEQLSKAIVRNKTDKHKANRILRNEDPSFYETEEARRIGDQLLIWQRCTGGWPKNIDMVSPMDAEEKAEVLAEKNRKNDSTTDNNATSLQMTFLARLYQATGDIRYRDGFCRGVEYLLSGQYPNGGWPQFWPEMRDYQVHITYNDDAMVNTMRLLKDIYDGTAPYGGKLVDAKLRQRTIDAFNRGIECILATQIRSRHSALPDATGEGLTVWCQQHDSQTLAPANARAYELPSYASAESAEIVRLLMSVSDPDDRIKSAVHAAMAWFEKYKLTGVRYARVKVDGEWQASLVQDPSAKDPLWGRYYDLQDCQVFVCDRDGVPRRSLEEIGSERRNGYAWYSSRPAGLFQMYEEWKTLHDNAVKRFR